MRVFVYFNLHKKVWSIKALDGDNKGKVIARLPSVSLTDAIFKVSEAGRQRVLKERRKNVHAGVVGYLAPEAEIPIQAKLVRYNPYLRGEFFDDNGSTITTAKHVRLTEQRKVMAW